ncbi:MAG: acyl transferase [Vicingaceae bacterium]
MEAENIKKQIFRIKNDRDFEEIALRVYNLQAASNPVFAEFLDITGRPKAISSLTQATFMPIDFYKTRNVVLGGMEISLEFKSSGTTKGGVRSRHLIHDIALYRSSFQKCFELFVGAPAEMEILSLLPNYEENKDSSLLFMVHELKKMGIKADRSFNSTEELMDAMSRNSDDSKETILFGVSFALLDMAERAAGDLSHITIIETGGMKGMRKEITREELYKTLQTKLNPKAILSEYGMTELLSQAYANQSGIFYTPPWMSISIRDLNDPFSRSAKSSGAINVIDLANLYSCSFIATEDLGRLYEDGGFEVLGRMDFSDIRGCNLLYEN